MAYVLGFFVADGTVTINKRGSHYFVFQISDKKLLSKIRKSMGSDHKISKRVHKKDLSIFYRLQIGSKEMCEDLMELGVYERKTNRLVLPNTPSKYFPHFLRGYFDGDGNVWTGLIHKDRKKQTLSIHTAFTSCSKPFLFSLHNRLREYQLKGGSLYCKNNAFCLKYSVKDSLLLYKLMYQFIDNGLFLSRKRKVFDSFLKYNTRS